MHILLIKSFLRYKSLICKFSKFIIRAKINKKVTLTAPEFELERHLLLFKLSLYITIKLLTNA